MHFSKRDKPPIKPWKHIGINLLIAFAVVAVTTVLLVVTAWNSLGQLGNQLSNMAGEQLPEVALAAKMTKLSSAIRTNAAQMVLVGNRGALDQAWLSLDGQLDRLAALNAQSDRESAATRSRIPALLKSARKNVKSLKDNVRQRLVLGEHISDMVERLRWLQADYVDEVRPLVADMRFQMRTAAADLDAARDRKDMGDAPERFSRIFSRQSAVMRANATGNLIIGLLMRAADETSLEELGATRHFLMRTAKSLASALASLRNDASAVSLRQYGAEILSFTRGQNDLLSVRRQSLDLARKSSLLLTRSRTALDQLDAALGKQVIHAQQQAEQATRVSLERIGHDRLMLALAMLIVLFISAGTGWLYVGRRVVRRLHSLRTSMLAIAAGDLDTRVDVSGDDEISEMANALLLFRDTALEVENSNAQSLIDNTIIGLVNTDAIGRIEAINPMAQRLFQLNDKKVIGQAFTTIFLAQEVQAGFSITEWAGIHDELFRETKGRRSDGQVFYLDIAVRAYYRRNERKYLITFADATQRHEARSLLEARIAARTADLKAANSRLKAEMEERMRAEEELVQTAKLAVLGQVAAELAHELNQPLSAIAYNVHNAREFIKRERYNEAHRALDKSAMVAARIGRIVSHLKAFARRPTRTLGPVELGRCIDAALMLFEEHITSRNIRVHRTPLNGDVQVYAERILLEQVLVNVISNALDAVATSNAPEVHLSETEDSSWIYLSVIDNGHGINETIRQHLFEPFFTTKEDGRGLGLGLSTSQKIMRDLGGDIVFEKSEKPGACVRLRLRKANCEVVAMHANEQM